MVDKMPGRGADQFPLRLPDGMRDRLKAVAADNGRSMNAEIVARLDASFSTWPRISIDPWIMDRANAAPADKKIATEAHINNIIEDFLKEEFPDPYGDADGVIEQFSVLLRRLPLEMRPKFQNEIEKIVQGVFDAAEDAADEAIASERLDDLEAGRTSVLPAEVSALILAGDRLPRALRKWRKKSRAAVAKAAGIPDKRLAAIEAGDEPMTAEIAAKLSQALDVPVGWVADV